MRKVNCALCGSTDYNVILATKDYRYHLTNNNFYVGQCKNCGLIYLNPMPDSNEIGKFYPEDVYYNESLASKTYSKILCYRKYRKVTEYKRGGKILDVGCGTGELLLLFERKNWDTYGVEISKVGYQIAKEKLKSNIFNCKLKECQFPDNYFDVVFLNHVLEHLSHPNDELRQIYRILKSSGILYISVPNIDSLQFKYAKESWMHLDVPRHIHFYFPETLEAILQKNGFKVIKLTAPYLDFPSDLYNSVKKFRYFAPFFLIATLLLKSHKKWRGTMEVFCIKINADLRTLRRQ